MLKVWSGNSLPIHQDILYSIEHQSEHPLADAITKELSDSSTLLENVSVEQVSGKGIEGTYEDRQVDLDKDENYKFYFNIGLTPEFDLKLGKEIEHTYYSVDLEEDLLNKQIDAYKQNYGSYLKVEEESVETDLIKGTLTEVENGEDKENGKVIENAILMPSYIKDEASKAKFIGSKVGDNIIFNPKTAYNNNEAEVASLLQSTKEEIKDVNSDFRFEINEVTRYKEAELNQELFDRVLGEGGATTEEEFS